MINILAPIKDFAEAYMDDIIVRSSSAEEHETHLQQVFELLRQHRLYAKLPKCTFNRPEVHYLGHVVGRHGLKVDPQKIETVAGWPWPKDVHQVRQFLGLTTSTWYTSEKRGFGRNAVNAVNFDRGRNDLINDRCGRFDRKILTVVSTVQWSSRPYDF